MKNVYFKTIMLKGEAGGTIASIEKTSSELNVDTYTITLNDGTQTTFEVTNGTSIASIEKTGTSGYQDTYTITLTDGSTSTFVVMNGEDGAGYEVPTDSIIYWDSADTIPEGYEAASNPDNSILDTKAEYNNLAKGVLEKTSLSSLESELVSICESMNDGEVRIYYIYPNFTSTSFFGGALQVAIITRRQSGIYRVAYPNICGDAYYYSDTWHYAKATMSSVTP